MQKPEFKCGICKDSVPGDCKRTVELPPENVTQWVLAKIGILKVRLSVCVDCHRALLKAMGEEPY